MKRGLAKKGSFLKFDSTYKNIDMERMQIKKAHHFDKVGEVTRNSVLMSILKGLFKSLIEKVRRVFLYDKFGF